MKPLFTEKQALQWFEKMKERYSAGMYSFRELAEKSGVPGELVHEYKDYCVKKGWRL